MPTQCNTKPLEFEGHGRRRVVADFDGGPITSDAGALLLRRVEQHLSLFDQVADCFTDHRNPDRVQHSLRTLIAQRIVAIALGYEDLNDHDHLRHDAVMALFSEQRHRRRDAAPLAGKSTLNRLEHAPAKGPDRYHKIDHDPEALQALLVELFLQAHSQPPDSITLDLDATDDPLHGDQQDRFFHGYYGGYCYLPLYFFSDRHLLSALLRPANIDASAGALEQVQRIVTRLRGVWPEVKILLRADSGFARETLMAWCEENQVDYLFGLARNSRLQEAIRPELARAKALSDQHQQPVRRFKDFSYRTHKSWSRKRRVVAKAEALPRGPNPRFVVTSLAAQNHPAQPLYEQTYCARGEMENRIKEQQLDLFADRTSTHTFRANQFRLSLTSIAYTLMEALRGRALKHTCLARATVGSLRLKLLKIGAQVTTSVRRIKVAMASGCPYQREFRLAWAQLPP